MPRTVLSLLAGLFSLVTLVTFRPWAGAAPRPEPERNWYVGFRECKGCHKQNWATWHKDTAVRPGAHRKAFQIMNLKGQKNPRCLKCHTTGYGHPSGTGFKSAQETPDLAMVGCEGCHGPGGLHVKLVKEEEAKGNQDMKGIEDFKIPAPRKESCVYCHKFHRHF